MATFDRSATGTIDSLRFSAAGVASGYAVALAGPPAGTRPPSLAVPLSLLVSSTSAINTDVAVQVSVDPAFGSLAYSNTLTNRADGIHSVTVSGLADQTKYYWRARAAETGTTTWTAWTPAWTFTPDLSAGKAFGYVYLNAGADAVPDPDSVGWVAENVGVAVTPSSVGFGAVSENVGVAVTLSGVGFGYAHYGDASTNPPDPRIWFLLPAAGRSGDGIRIFCFGVGDLAATFSGSVELDYGSILGWVAVPVISWQTFPPGPEAYTALRKLDPAAGYIDMQHTVIEIVIPDGAVPPGYPVRIRTVTP
jgi:hypothetical protein